MKIFNIIVLCAQIALTVMAILKKDITEALAWAIVTMYKVTEILTDK